MLSGSCIFCEVRPCLKGDGPSSGIIAGVEFTVESETKPSRTFPEKPEDVISDCVGDDGSTGKELALEEDEASVRNSEPSLVPVDDDSEQP